MRLQLVAMTLFAMSVSVMALAGDNGHEGKHLGHGKGASRAFCPHCGDACYPTVTKGTETKSCWDVETKTICIPRVRFPWEADCGKGKDKDGCPTPKCGRTKCVNVLMKYEYECSTCKYSWDVDSYKDGKGKSDKAPTEAEPNVVEPPTVEAYVPPSNRRAAPAGFEQNATGGTATNSYTKILSSLFK